LKNNDKTYTNRCYICDYCEKKTERNNSYVNWSDKDKGFICNKCLKESNECLAELEQDPDNYVSFISNEPDVIITTKFRINNQQKTYFEKSKNPDKVRKVTIPMSYAKVSLPYVKCLDTDDRNSSQGEDIDKTKKKSKSS